ncbi:hypothetical protein EF847_02980 [Actinobacteria bacterium YIM 96077]|uniref:Uncharacterized protein n=1 Tax=Phytoactinopolyspora halophila TaxID=1981511 RepID=A0A329QC81_9ACTN|nr:hypothetical protein [Phytoactinopolyspora halophila]AYY11836.1 hypothetical protein EF847_02980 [Actinobacteria bacterium YIM 96077]RAW09857.1 hypothetical protein DPM12_20155 [Phytoactinopolyspora halophila]
MSAQVAIICDYCGDIGDFGTAAQDLRARMNGWTWRNGLDICPLCKVVETIRERRHDDTAQPA